MPRLGDLLVESKLVTDEQRQRAALRQGRLRGRFGTALLEEDVSDPIVVLGWARSGTTKLQRFLSADPRFQATPAWAMFNPAPFPGETRGDPTPRIDWANAMMNAVTNCNDTYQVMHEFEAREPDETSFIPLANFDSPSQCITTPDPVYLAWARRQSRIPAIEYTRKMLQYLQWQDGGGRGRPWILKSPAHLGHFPLLLKTFPDATIVHCHRDPRVIIPSFASLLEAGRRMGSDDVDPHQVGTDTLEYWAAQMRRNVADRATVDPARIIDVSYERIRDDATSVIAGIYARAGREVTPEAAAAFAEYEERRPEGHFGGHTYTAEQFGLTDERIDAEFAEYLQRFPELRTATSAGLAT